MREDFGGIGELERRASGMSFQDNQGLKKPKRSCPFCGGHDIEVYEHYGTAVGIDYGGFFPECTECGCRLSYYHSREAAIDAWDRRFGEW
jgi:Lar family restriction alleviation protein